MPVFVWCGWQRCLLSDGLKLGPPPPPFRCFFFFTNRKREIKDGLWKHRESCNYLLSPCLSDCLSPSLFFFLCYQPIFSPFPGHSLLSIFYFICLDQKSVDPPTTTTTFILLPLSFLLLLLSAISLLLLEGIWCRSRSFLLEKEDKGRKEIRWEERMRRGWQEQWSALLREWRLLCHKLDKNT